MIQAAPLFEEWRAVPGFEGLYEVSSEGRVRSARRVGTPGRVLAESFAGRDRRYSQVCLSRAGRKTYRNVHRLVCEAFHGPPPFEGAQVLHGDHDASHNAARNLRWGTREENLEERDARRSLADCMSAALAQPLGGRLG